ncbi:hypothetical protein VP01_1099g7 [Puccinia sorghi]|uniref:Uncharacterized protein n=1 Tax=Puccinia sorghi TaxID=27349 RepID=A0A0L6VT65_9BASI|nr:hypothetical protein VP01_1099g7 [Puccinia sorghi]
MSVTLISRRAFQAPAFRSSFCQRTLVSSFSTSPKSNDIVGKVQDAAHAVNKKAGEMASKSVENLEAASNKVKQATNTVTGQARNSLSRLTCRFQPVTRSLRTLNTKQTKPRNPLKTWPKTPRTRSKYEAPSSSASPIKRGASSLLACHLVTFCVIVSQE